MSVFYSYPKFCGGTLELRYGFGVLAFRKILKLLSRRNKSKKTAVAQ